VIFEACSPADPPAPRAPPRRSQNSRRQATQPGAISGDHTHTLAAARAVRFALLGSGTPRGRRT
jgi:hypothetical protein